MEANILGVNNVTVQFGGIIALSDVSLEVTPGTIHAVIGPNGAGKSTLLNVISGIYSATKGDVSFEGERLSGLAGHEINAKGVARTFQNTELFKEMTALENVKVGLDRFHACGVINSALHTKQWKKSDAEADEAARELLKLVGLGDDETSSAGILPFGKQRRLEIARALATRPKLLLLDEPAAGLRAAEVEDLIAILRELKTNQGLTILIIDHVMALVMAISDRISVLNFGHKIADGAPKEIRESAEVIKAYLGEKAADAYST
ncbi:ABC transporter ATP-binding protein [Sneathiella litorea]|uniref:ATP-binding cassette domain-containing protein n=1 Tax=Sneathiella litorea TaxID=2606216 RepID=A0A6L8W6H4_9PROT|nr:ABC transporter ATP-binding protein [Sneathiella litorea]MZR30746.1 ATP-binding cassette domain-containing protein [Sneathiella litorea]